MTEQKNLPDILLDIFAQGNPFRYQAPAYTLDFKWTPGHMRPTHIYGHLRGEYVIGAEGHDQGSYTTTFLSWTTQAKGNADYARSLMSRLCDALLPLQPSIAFLGHATYVAYLFLSEPLGIRQADSLGAYVRFKVAPALSHTPKELGAYVALPLHPNSRFVDPVQGWEEGPEIDAITALTTTYTRDEVLAIRKLIPDLSLAQQAALNFREGSIYPILLDWIADNPEGASIPRRMTELYAILQGVAETKGHAWNWSNEGALALHMQSKFVREGLRQHLGMVRERRRVKELRADRWWYSFRCGNMVNVE